jgi:predicted ATP-grasp superfamily ATP-dependent carboligase
LKILVTDGEQRSALAATRSLARAGHAVFVGSAASRPIAGASNACQIEMTFPDPFSDAPGYVAAVVEAIDEHDVDVLLPMTDVSATLLLPIREQRPEVLIPFADAEVYRAISDKHRLMEVAADGGVPVPPQIVLRAPVDEVGAVVERVNGELGFPMVVKPALSIVMSTTGPRRTSVQIAHDPAELAELLSSVPDFWYPLLLQKRIQGAAFGVFVLALDGEILSVFAHRRLREKPPSGGVSVYRESVPVRDDLRTHAVSIASRFRWTGAAMVEFKEDESTGTPYLMEVNARFWGSLQLTIDAGLDFPAWLVAISTGDEVALPLNYRAGVRSRWFWGDVDHLLAMVRTSRADRRSLGLRHGRLSTLVRFMIPWSPGLSWEVFRISDIRPFLRESRAWFAGLGQV